jgi:hypothetical protein
MFKIFVKPGKIALFINVFNSYIEVFVGIIYEIR